MGIYEYTSDTGQRLTRPLMTPAEVKECEDALIFCGHHRVIRLPLRPYYKHLKYKWLTELPPFEPKVHDVDKLPPLIQLD